MKKYLDHDQRGEFAVEIRLRLHRPLGMIYKPVHATTRQFQLSFSVRFIEIPQPSQVHPVERSSLESVV